MTLRIPKIRKIETPYIHIPYEVFRYLFQRVLSETRRKLFHSGIPWFSSFFGCLM